MSEFDAIDEQSMRTMRGDTTEEILGRIDQYDVIRKLGGGGFGVVYLVRDTLSNVEYAIKTLHPLFKSNLEEMENLKWQFLLVSKLSHPNIASAMYLHPVKEVVYATEEVRNELRLSTGDFVMLMKYAPGVTLSKWRKQFPNGIVPVDKAIDICKQIASALDYAHSEKIIHRDIKPGNIMIETRENGSICVRVLDFGLAAEIRSSMSRVSTDKGYTSGVRPYMAPEQWMGKKQGPATDQYALAVMFYELVSGVVPFATGDFNAMMYVIENREPQTLGEINSSQNKALMRALSEDSNRRWNSCSEFVNNLAANKKTSKKLLLYIALIVIVLAFIFVVVIKSDRNDVDKNQISTQSSVPNHKDSEQSNPNEYYNLGEKYYKEQDYAEAVKWFRKAADQGHAPAQCNLGFCYDNGQGVPHDSAEAVKWYRKSADQGNAPAQCNLGFCYDNGQGVPQDYAEAVKWYRKAADQGHARAQFNLGVCYKNGQGVSQDYAEAVKWYRKAAEQGHAPAQNNLGICYENGDGVEKDIYEAVKWYRKAVDQGNARAQFNLGVCYEYGKGVSQDYAEAVKWYRKAADQGYARAQNNLGVCYEYGKGVSQDYAEAVKWYRKAADQGYARAQNNLGICYENGDGVEKDIYEAVKWYRKSADQGNAYAQCNLGFCYENGDGVEKDIYEAVKWYRKAADQGHARAQNNLGICYENGNGVEKDIYEAVKWYRKAADQGDASAKDALKRLGE